MKTAFSHVRRALLLAALACSATGAALAQDYPAHPIRFIVPFSPGGSSDIVARLLAKDGDKVMGQPFVIDNKPGAAAMIGLNELVQAKPDGYTIGITNSGMVTQPLYGIAKYNYVTELQPIAQIGEVPFVLVVKGDSPWKTLGEFMDYCKANPTACNYGITGIGNTSHLGPAQLTSMAKFPMEFVNFDGGGTLITSLLGGHIQAGGINPVDIREYVKAGKIRILCVFGEKRLADPLFANAPTARELGYDIVVTLWQGIGAPKNMPDAVRTRLADSFAKIINNPQTQQQLRAIGIEPAYMGPAEFAKKWSAEQAHYKQVVTDTGILQLVRGK